jgi:nicotinamide riboside transporter PnuC
MLLRMQAALVRTGTLNALLQIVGAVCGLAGAFYINERDVLGFYLWVISNGALIWLQFRVRLMVLVMLHIAYLSLALQGIYLWSSAAGS